MVLASVTKKAPKKEVVEAAQEEAPSFERVTWYKDPGLRKLYFYAFILCIASATTGYDGYVACPSSPFPAIVTS